MNGILTIIIVLRRPNVSLNTPVNKQPIGWIAYEVLAGKLQILSFCELKIVFKTFN